MSPSNHSRTSRFVIFAALAALTGCGAEASTSVEASASAATFQQTSIDHGHDLGVPQRESTLSVSRRRSHRRSTSGGIRAAVLGSPSAPKAQQH